MPSTTRSNFVSLAFAAAVAGSMRGAMAQGLTPIRVLGNANDDATSLFYAMRSGLFGSAGLDVHIDPGTSGAAVAAAVAAGSYDIGKSSVNPILEAHQNGIPFAMLAPAGIQNADAPFAGLLMVKDSPIRTGADLNGQVVGLTSLSSISRVAISSWVDKNGGDWRAVKYVEISSSEAPGAVAQKRVVAAECGQPLLQSVLDGGTFRLLPAYEAIAPRFLLTTWFTTKDWSAKHPDAARAFARVVARAATYTNAHHAETVAMMAEVSHVDAAVIAKMQRVVDGTVLEPGLLQPTIDASAKYGTLKAAFPAREIIDPNALTR